jgi:subtilisin family serine protease
VTPDGSLPDGVTHRIIVGSGTTQQIIKLLQSDDRIEAAEENMPVRSPIVRQTSIAFNEGVLSPVEWLTGTPVSERLHLALAHSGARGRGVKVAIIDTGVNKNHVVLRGRVTSDSYDFVDGDHEPQDVPDFVDNDLDGTVDEATGHGTHVTGLVALVSPASPLLCLRVLNSDGQGTAYHVAQAIEYAVNHGARVINLSIRLSNTSSAVDAAFEYARTHGAILVTAAGNSGYIEYPAYDVRVWAVAALGTANFPASFTSSFVGVALSAPGENILSTSWDGNYAAWSGTSMSAPLVAGSAALVLSRFQDFTPDQVLALLQASSAPISGNPVGMGAGAVDPGAAVGAAGQPNFPQQQSARLSH